MTIENLLLSSYEELAVTAIVYNWLVLGAERFTRQRLEALAHAESRASGKFPFSRPGTEQPGPSHPPVRACLAASLAGCQASGTAERRASGRIRPR
jgi:hypothetical protein